MERNMSDEIVSELVSNGNSFIKSITNDSDEQLRVIFASNSSNRSKEDFQHFVRKTVNSIDKTLDIDFITVDSDVICVIEV